MIQYLYSNNTDCAIKVTDFDNTFDLLTANKQMIVTNLQSNFQFHEMTTRQAAVDSFRRVAMMEKHTSNIAVVSILSAFPQEDDKVKPRVGTYSEFMTKQFMGILRSMPSDVFVIVLSRWAVSDMGRPDVAAKLLSRLTRTAGGLTL